jgi:hypothetical protein
MGPYYMVRSIARNWFADQALRAAREFKKFFALKPSTFWLICWLAAQILVRVIQIATLTVMRREPSSMGPQTERGEGKCKSPSLMRSAYGRR